MRLMTSLAVILCCAAVMPAYTDEGIGQLETKDERSDMEIIRARILEELLAPETTQEEIAELVDRIQDDGSWDYIDYNDVSRTGWDHRRHLQNLLQMARAYRREDSAFYEDPKLKEASLAALDFWLENDFKSDNWWWIQIGTPNQLIRSLILLDPVLNERQREGGARIAGRANLRASGARPGGDLIFIAGIMAFRAVFENDEEMMREAVDAMAGEIRIATGRGMQPDFSFHHRTDRVISTLSYGAHYPQNFATWAVRLRGTEFAFPEEPFSLLIDYYLDGICRSLAHGTYNDPGAENRGLTRKTALNPRSARIPRALLQCSDYRAEELERIAAVREGRMEPNFTYNKFFWRSEYFTHQRPKYFASVRMYSNRNHNVEQPYNNEGLKNHHLADGANFITRTGEEYVRIFPAWDWQKIPGTTVAQKPNLAKGKGIVQRGRTSFVGGASDGVYGAAAFDFESPHDPLKARKAWFCFDDEYRCLGAGIDSDARHPVVTTLNQCLLKTKVSAGQNDNIIVLERGTHSLEEVSWVWHDGVAYLFSDPADVEIQNKKVAGDWRDINEQYDHQEVERDVFALWLNHGVRPANDDYEYTVVPGLPEAEVENYRARVQVETLANTSKIQAVKHGGLNMCQAVFYEAGKLTIDEGITLTSNSPAIILISINEGKVDKLTVADPTRNLDSISLEISAPVPGEDQGWEIDWNEREGISLIKADLPRDEYAGQSVTLQPQ